MSVDSSTNVFKTVRLQTQKLFRVCNKRSRPEFKGWSESHTWNSPSQAKKFLTLKSFQNCDTKSLLHSEYASLSFLHSGISILSSFDDCETLRWSRLNTDGVGNADARRSEGVDEAKFISDENFVTVTGRCKVSSELELEVAQNSSILEMNSKWECSGNERTFQPWQNVFTEHADLNFFIFY